MQNAESTGCRKAVEMIEEARKAGLTVAVSAEERDSSTLLRVEFGYAVPEYAKGTGLENALSVETVAVAWRKSHGKGARWSMLTATEHYYGDSRKLRTVKAVHVRLLSMGMEVERHRARQAEVDAESAAYDVEVIASGVELIKRANRAIEARRGTDRVGSSWRSVPFGDMTPVPTYVGVMGKAVLHASDDGRSYVVHTYDFSGGALKSPVSHKGLDAAFNAGERLVAGASESVSARVSPCEASGRSVVSAVASEPLGGGVGAVSPLVEGERRAAVDAERLVPRGERMVVRVTRGLSDVSSTEERSFVVGVVASLLRAGGRSSSSDGCLVVRCDGETMAVVPTS